MTWIKVIVVLAALALTGAGATAARGGGADSGFDGSEPLLASVECTSGGNAENPLALAPAFAQRIFAREGEADTRTSGT